MRNNERGSGILSGIALGKAVRKSMEDTLGTIVEAAMGVAVGEK